MFYCEGAEEMHPVFIYILLSIPTFWELVLYYQNEKA